MLQTLTGRWLGTSPSRGLKNNEKPSRLRLSQCCPRKPANAELLSLTDAGLYCPAGDFHIDPLRPVDRAVITHGHSDHARAGHGAVLATAETLDIMQARYGEDCFGTSQALALDDGIKLGAVKVSLHPAGHILGSAQVLIEGARGRAAISGDYKCRPDTTCAPYEPVACDVFVTEATFGLPVFRHPLAAEEIGKLLRSLQQFPERTHLAGAYPLGKAQRVIRLLREAGYDEAIWLHGAMVSLCKLYERWGIKLGDIRALDPSDKKAARGGVVMCPPSAATDRWARRFADPVVAFASGWMRVRARGRQRGVELPLVISDHVDWDELREAVDATRCAELWVTHGAEDGLVHWATKERGLKAKPLHMLGYGEDDEAAEVAAAEPAP